MKALIPYFHQPEITIPLPFEVMGLKAVPIHGFGVLVALGFLVGGRIAMDRAKKRGLDPEAINRLIGWLVVGTFVGGHVGNELMYEWDKVVADPMILLRVWDGLSSWGGFLACIPITILFFRSEKLPVWEYADCIAYGLAMGWFLGRMGCFVAHDHPGGETNFPLGVYGICTPGNNQYPAMACHDTGLYEALWALGVFGLFWVLDKKPRPTGFYPLLLGALYGPARFALEFMRPDTTDARWWGGLTPAQYWSAIFGVVCLGLLIARMRTAPLAPGVQPAPEKASP